MKKGLKFWSKLLIASFFLGGMATSAIAQNGAETANCAVSLQTFTRTVDQMDSLGGTVLKIKFNVTAENELQGDNYYVVAETNGSLNSIALPACSSIGQNLNFVGTGAQGITMVDDTPTANRNYTGSDDNSLADPVGQIPENGEIILRVNAEARGLANQVYKLGIFTEDIAGEHATRCFSDVYWVEIEVIANIYAKLVLHNGYAKEYICNGTQTTTNIGFDLCQVPAAVADDADARLYYTLNLTNTDIRGMKNGANSIDQYGTDIQYDVTYSTIAASGLRIGQQTLTNESPEQANSVVYTFVEGLNNFYLEYDVTENGTDRRIKLPILFITETANCDGGTPAEPTDYTADQMSHKFTVHVAPAFTVEALAYLSADDRTNATNATTTFCQGTVAYLDANTSVTTGDNSVITTYGYNWTVAGNLATDANIEQPNSKELVNAGEDTYTFTVTAQWDDEQTDGVASGNWATVTGIEGGAGCKITSAGLVIDVTAAPILLVATDKVVQNVDGVEEDVWNTTNVITANTYCPGQTVYINTLTEGTPVIDGTNRVTQMEAGNYIKHNGAEIKWTINVPTSMGAYTTWRTTTVGAEGEIAVTNPDANPDVTHYLDNESVAPTGIITYTLENAGTTTNTCKLVKSDGSSLNLAAEKDGKVQVRYPVSVRPTFGLAN